MRLAILPYLFDAENFESFAGSRISRCTLNHNQLSVVSHVTGTLMGLPCIIHWRQSRLIGSSSGIWNFQTHMSHIGVFAMRFHLPFTGVNTLRRIVWINWKAATKVKETSLKWIDFFIMKQKSFKRNEPLISTTQNIQVFVKKINVLTKTWL